MNGLITFIGSAVLGMLLAGAGTVIYAMYYRIVTGQPSELEASFWRAWEHYQAWRAIERLKRKAGTRHI